MIVVRIWSEEIDTYLRRGVGMVWHGMAKEWNGVHRLLRTVTWLELGRAEYFISSYIVELNGDIKNTRS